MQRMQAQPEQQEPQEQEQCPLERRYPAPSRQSHPSQPDPPAATAAEDRPHRQGWAVAHWQRIPPHIRWRSSVIGQM
jgi:hypothetical protein